MEAYIKESGIVAPLDRANVDTDQIIPKQFLKRIERTGFGEFLFYDWRYKDDGTPDPDFILNHKKYKGASILIARDNFGSGSSREHAPWALKEYGFKTIIAPSFADIFYNNCFKNSILPVEMDREVVNKLFENTLLTDRYELTVDLEEQKIHDQMGSSWSFEVDGSKKEALLKGLDDISQTLLLEKHIKKYEESIKDKPWTQPQRS